MRISGTEPSSVILKHRKFWCSQNATNQPNQQNMASCALVDSLVNQQWHQVVEIQKEPSTKMHREKRKRWMNECMNHFKSDLLHNMDHMHILGTEPSSVILSQKSSFQSWTVIPKVPKQTEAKWDGVISTKNYNLNLKKKLTQNILMLSKRYESTAIDRSNMKYKKRLLLRCIYHFESDLINKIDLMRISGTKPSSVILRQKSIFKIQKEMSQTCQNKLKLKGMV